MYCIGLMSGTSVDGIDAALVEISGTDIDLQVQLVAGETFLYPEQLREQILAVASGEALSLAELATLDDAIATQFALAAENLRIEAGNLPVELIGSHGQTVFHRPPLRKGQNSRFCLGYSLQLGRGEVIANLIDIKTVSDFRAADIAAGGEGAPLVAKVDAYLLSHPDQDRCIQNIGGIGNFTYLPDREQLNWEEKICGWDTGPGNTLLDLAVKQLTDGQRTYDKDGNWASEGIPCQTLVNQWLKQAFFHQPPPKSTGRELFGEAYLAQCWQDAQDYHLTQGDWLATLTELTVASIVHSYRNFLPRMPAQVLLCGGGSRNLYLKQRLQAQLAPQTQVLTTDEVGVSGDFKEAIAFALLAYWRCLSIPGNLPQVTGATKAKLLGEIHFPILSEA